MKSYLPITLYWKEIETWGWVHCVLLVNAHRLICNMTYLGQLRSPRDLDLRSNFQIDLSRSKSTWFDAPWREKHGGGKIISLSLLGKNLFAMNHFRKNRSFWLWWPLETKVLYWGQIWRKNVTWAAQGLSNAFFGFLLAIIVSEL